MTAVAASRAQAFQRPGLGSVLAAEWLKIRTVRSTFWTVISTMIVTVGLSFLLALAFTSSYNDLDPADRASFDPASYSLSGINFGMIAMAVLGVMVITSEYATGSIRTTLAAVPNRLRLLLAKLLVLLGVSLVVGMISSYGAFFAAQVFYSSKDHLGASITDNGILRAVTGGGLYLTLIALFSLAVGAILRHTAGALATVLGVLFVLPIVGTFLPGSWGDTVRKYLPSNAGSAIVNTQHSSDTLAPWTGFAVFVAYTAVLLVVAFLLFEKRDA